MCSDSLNGRASEIVIKGRWFGSCRLRSEFQKDQGKSALIFPFPGKPVRLTAVVISHKRELFLNKDDDGF